MSNRSVSSTHTLQLEDIPEELIHHIQSFLPAKEAARTCILSKSWLHAWSTIPTLRFPSQFQFHRFVTAEQHRKYQKVINHTLQRYHRDNISIQRLDLEFYVDNQESDFAAEKWIQHIVSKSCLRELSLEIRGLTDSFTLPNELFSSENLSTINVTGEIFGIYRVRICSNPLIKSVILRVLVLQYVIISEEVLHNLLSTCTLLEMIELQYCIGLKNVMVKNLHHLRELVISPVVLEINNLPSLRLINYRARDWGSNKPVSFLDIIKSKLPLLECLTLRIENCGHESLVITSASLKSLTLDLREQRRQVNVQVYAPKLLNFSYDGREHGLLFPTIAPKDINLRYFLSRPLDNLFFLTLKEVLNSSSKFNIHIIEQRPAVPLNIDVDDLRRRCSFPVTNVHNCKLWYNKFMNVNTGFCVAFFLIFHPSYIMLPQLVLREMMEKHPTDQKEVELKNPYNGKWETLISSSSSFLDELTHPGWVECKLNWVSRSHSLHQRRGIWRRISNKLRHYLKSCCKHQSEPA